MPRKKKAETASPAVSSKTKASKAARPPKIPKVKKAKGPGLKPPKAPSSPKAVVHSKKGSPAVSGAAIPSWKKLPRKGETQMVAFIRDPRCIFTYWEVTPESVEAAKKELMAEFKDSSMVLRVFKISPEGKADLLYEVKVEPGERNRYVELKEGGRYFIEIVQKTASGRTAVYARSNIVLTSPDSFSSSVIDPQWKPPAGILEYFSDEEGFESFLVPGGISSAEAHKRAHAAKGKRDRYFASRTS
jgi:hypothetical protein